MTLASAGSASASGVESVLLVLVWSEVSFLLPPTSNMS